MNMEGYSLSALNDIIKGSRKNYEREALRWRKDSIISISQKGLNPSLYKKFRSMIIWTKRVTLD